MEPKYRNVQDLEIYELEELQVNEFHPENDGKGEPTEVHMCLKPVGAPPNMLLVLRLKSKRAINEVVDALVKHRDNVWPEN